MPSTTNGNTSAVRTNRPRVHVLDLPDELLVHVLSFLDPRDLAACSALDHRFHALMRSAWAWKRAFQRYFSGATDAPLALAASWPLEYRRRVVCLRQTVEATAVFYVHAPRGPQLDRMVVDDAQNVYLAYGDSGSVVKVQLDKKSMTQVGRYAGSGQRNVPSCIDFTPTRFAFGYESGHLRLALCNPSGPAFRQVDVTLPDALTRLAWTTDSGSPDTLVAATRRNMVAWVHVPKHQRAVTAMSPPLALHPSSAIVAIAATESAQTVVATSDRLYVLAAPPRPTTAATPTEWPFAHVSAPFGVDDEEPITAVHYTAKTHPWAYVTRSMCPDVLVYDVVQNTVVATLAHGAPVSCVSVTTGAATLDASDAPTRTLVLVGDMQGTLWLWTVDPYLAPTPLPAATATADAPPPAPGARTSFQPDLRVTYGLPILTSPTAPRITLSRALHGHASPITALFMDAARILSAGDSGWVRLWDPVAGTCLKRTLARSRANPTPDDRIIGVSVAPAVGGAVPPRLFIAFASGLVRTLEKRPPRRRLRTGKGGAQAGTNGANAGAPAIHDIRLEVREMTEDDLEHAHFEHKARRLNGDLDLSEAESLQLAMSMSELELYEPVVPTGQGARRQEQNMAAHWNAGVDEENALALALAQSLAEQ
ncbi:hypothetical protein GGF31_001926 [Allomyces arbusculus]|nr:hypothetical protein GGF31_001926 [Allomyces arbusculus]